MRVQIFTLEMGRQEKKDYANVVISNVAIKPNYTCPTSCMQASRELARLIFTQDSRSLVNQIHVHINYVEVIANPPSFFKFTPTITDYCDDEVLKMNIAH